MSWSSGFVFKGISHRRFKFKKCLKFDYNGPCYQDYHDYHIFWSYNFRVFDTTKFVTFCKS